MVEDVFIELGLIIVITVVIGGIMRLLKQPLMIGYILAGIIVSPYFLNIVHSTDNITTFAQIGIALLLFMVGLNLSPKIIKDVGKVSLIAGIGQFLFTAIIGFFIAKLLDFSNIVSLYISIALTFSSTIIITKLLSDKGDLETLYGRIAIGILIVQDIIAILILIVLSAPISNGINSTLITLETLLKGIALLVSLLLISIYLIPKITTIVAKSQEFLLLFSIGWCLALASIFYYFNFSLEIGALLAGITLSMSPYQYEISSKMKPLRDFFIILFFILLGSQMIFANISQYIYPMIIFSIFILIGNPIIVMILMGVLGYSKRNSFLVGLTVAQISEFSLILIAFGVKLNHITNEILSLVTMIGLITIASSTYLILYGHKIYPYISKYLNIFERRGKKIDVHKYHKNITYELILFGCNRMGSTLLHSLKKIKKKFIVVDYNPETIINLAKQGIESRYGDADDIELLDELKIQKAKMIISTLPDYNTNVLLITKIRKSNKKTIIIAVSDQINEAINLYSKGASYVIIPKLLGGYKASKIIESHGLNYNRFLKERVSHIKLLENKKTSF